MKEIIQKRAKIIWETIGRNKNPCYFCPSFNYCERNNIKHEYKQECIQTITDYSSELYGWGESCKSPYQH